jgi:predicted N-acetyltransferase YhbS
MSKPAYSIVPQPDGMAPEIETLLDEVFGLGRHTKTSYRLREGERAVAGLSFVARGDDGALLGAISFWQLFIGAAATPALLLGPLAVKTVCHGQGIGRALMRHGLEAAATLGHELVILVGDEPYYARVGFARVPDGKLLLPGPVDPDRLLYKELANGALAPANGLVKSPRRQARVSAPRGTT